MFRRIVNTGVSSGLGQGLTRKVRIVNLASLLTVGLFGFFTIVLIVKALWFHATVYLLFALLFIVPIWINSRGRYRLARAALLSQVAFALLAVEFIIRSDSRGIFLICLLLLGVFLAESRWETVLVYAFTALMFVFINMVPGFVDVSAIRPESQFAYWLNMIIGAVGMYMLLNMFISDAWKFQQQLASTNRELEEQWSEADRQRETAASQAEMLSRTSLELRTLNNNLLEGIRYARRIQNSMLVKKEMLHLHLSDTLLFYKPKDVLSGDFYWFARKDGFLFVAVADCTGHGVPGALMTVMGNNLLHQIVSRDGILAPAEILTELDRRLTVLLAQRRSAADVVNDGMDMGLVRIDRGSGQAVFASAKRPLYLFDAATGALTEYPASKLSIGGHRTESKAFVQSEVTCSAGDMLYLTSDGFTDQFGPTGKFLPKRFRQVLADIHPLPMPEQHRVLNETLLRWRKQEPQTDDVLVFGFRIPAPVPC